MQAEAQMQEDAKMGIQSQINALNQKDIFNQQRQMESYEQQQMGYDMEDDCDMGMDDEMDMNMEGLQQQMQQNHYNPLRQKDH